MTYNVAPTVVAAVHDRSGEDRRGPGQTAGRSCSARISTTRSAHSLEAAARRAASRAGTIDRPLGRPGASRRPATRLSHETVESAAAAARAAHVRVFASRAHVRGCRSLRRCKKLARDTGGRYIETTSIGQLQKIYTVSSAQASPASTCCATLCRRPGQAHHGHGAQSTASNGVAATEYRTPALAVATKGRRRLRTSRRGPPRSPRRR